MVEFFGYVYQTDFRSLTFSRKILRSLKFMSMEIPASIQLLRPSWSTLSPNLAVRQIQHQKSNQIVPPLLKRSSVASSLQTYQSHLKNQIVPCLSEVKAQELTPTMVDAWIKKLLHCGLSRHTLLHTYPIQYSTSIMTVISSRRSKPNQATATLSVMIFYSANSDVGSLTKSKTKNNSAAVMFTSTAKVTGISSGNALLFR